MSDFQQTIKYPVSITGYALHSGQPVNLKISEAPPNSGIMFFSGNGKRFSTIELCSTKITKCVLSTDISDGENTISTIEHLMSALHALKIDNVKITLSGGDEIPILDGSSSMWFLLLKSAGVVKQDHSRKYLTIEEEVWVYDGEDKWILAQPYDGLFIECVIDFDHPSIGKQRYSINMDEVDYYKDISFARTFGFYKDFVSLRKLGYLKGGDEDTAIILDDEGIMNGDLRYPNEFVRHKLLDLIGDIYVNGPIKGKLLTYCSGHKLNNKLMRELNERFG